MNWKNTENKRFIQAILALKTADEARHFLRDLMTAKEIEEFGQAIRESNGHFPLADINDGVQNVLLIKSFHMSIKK